MTAHIPEGIMVRDDLIEQVSKIFNGAIVSDVRVDLEFGNVTATVNGMRNVDAGFIEQFVIVDK